MDSAPQQYVYFVSGMWCSTCAKSITELVSKIEGVASANINYASKLLLVRPKVAIQEDLLDKTIQSHVSRIGFGIKRQSDGWVLDFQETLKNEANQKISWVRVSLIWFLAMWSSMFAFAGYIGGEITSQEHYWLSVVSSLFGLPAILLGLPFYANAGIRALWYSRLLTLDLFIFIGGCSAFGVTLLSLLSHSPVTYADSGSMIIAILLLTKKIENSITTSVTSNILFQLHPKKKDLELFKKGEWVKADVSQVKRESLIRIGGQETVPLDGVLESDSAQINNHLMSGESHLVSFKKGDHIFAGAIAQDELVLKVLSPQGERKIDAWAEIALLSGSKKSEFSKIFSRIENNIVLVGFLGAFLAAGVQAYQGANSQKIVESFFVGILIFCPCLFASIIPLAKQMTHLSLLKSGILLSRSEALLDLTRIRKLFFDKTGTLEAVESTYIPFESAGERAYQVIPFLKNLSGKSQHITMRGLNLNGESQEAEVVQEIPGKGLLAKTYDGSEIAIGSESFMQEKGLSTYGLNPSYSFVSLNNKLVGQIFRKGIYDKNSRQFLKKLLKLRPDLKVEILSGDPTDGAGKIFTDLDQRIHYLGHLSPEKKADIVDETSAFVGDGLNDTLALAKAKVGFRIGHRIQGFAPVDFYLQIPNLDLILTTIGYSKKYKNVLIQTACAAIIYNILAFSLAAMGKFSPLGAVLSMLLSFSVMLLSIYRLNKIPHLNS